MANAPNKTQPGSADIEAFLATVEPEVRRADARSLLALFTRVTGQPAVLWGPSMIGFGQYHYRYESGREGDYFRSGFSPRKANLSLYLMAGYADPDCAAEQARLLARLGPHKTGKSCLYITRLDQVDMQVLEELVRLDYAAMNRLYPD